jgi:hypothetical protein
MAEKELNEFSPTLVVKVLGYGKPIALRRYTVTHDAAKKVLEFAERIIKEESAKRKVIEIEDSYAGYEE